jgi:predicted ATPase
MRTLEKLTIKNFKSIREQTLALGRLNVFIGGNGAGKSNLIGAFRFLREIVNQNLSGYVGSKGGADTLLHFGRKKSRQMSFHLEFVKAGINWDKAARSMKSLKELGREGDTANGYEVRLVGTDDDSLVIGSETAFYHELSRYPDPFELKIATSGKESNLKKTDHICARQVMRDLDSYRVYHFHDTSETAAVKGSANVEDNRVLRPQAENLAAFLYWMQEKKADHFANVQDTVRQIAPFFDEFRLAPSKLNEGKIRLEWKEKGSDAYFNAASLSDGTLRFMCLATLLLQPELLAVVLLDEPELGLHRGVAGRFAEVGGHAHASDRGDAVRHVGEPVRAGGSLGGGPGRQPKRLPQAQPGRHDLLAG